MLIKSIFALKCKKHKMKNIILEHGCQYSAAVVAALATCLVPSTRTENRHFCILQMYIYIYMKMQLDFYFLLC